jgi:uncharacterized membrane protein YphA (DoxX/SURF4 family)
MSRWLHVDYVTSGGGAPHLDPGGYFLQTLQRPLNLALVIGVAAAVLGGIGTVLVRSPSWDWSRRTVERLDSYRTLLPWILRLAAGLPLIGAGLVGYDFAPDVHQHLTPPRMLAFVGFFLLAGFLTRPAALVGLVLYAAALMRQPHLLEVFEFAGLLTASAVTGGGRPSLDDLIAQAFPRLVPRLAGVTQGVHWREPQLEAWVGTILRIGIGLSFVAAGLGEKLLDPGRASLAVAHYHLTSVIPVDAGMWILGAGSIEVGLGMLLVAGFLTRDVAALAFGVLTLTFFALPDDPVLAHVGLFGGTSALVIVGGGRYALSELLGHRQPFAGKQQADHGLGVLDLPRHSH